MERITWTDHVRNELFERVKEEKSGTKNKKKEG
jgi:hypothetical protein